MPVPPETASLAEGRKRLEKFVKAFEGSQRANVEAAEAIRELTDALVGEKDSMAAYFDELIDSNQKLAKEVHGLRKDLRALSQSQGIGGIFEILTGGG